MHFTNAAAGWTKDTTIVIFDWGNGNLATAGNGLGAPVSNNLLRYNLSFTPTHAFYDDSSRTLTNGSMAKLATLAVNFSNIQAYRQGNDIAVEWTVFNQQNTIEYEIETSLDGIAFSSAASLRSKPDAPGELKYQWLDIAVSSGDHFYRILARGVGGDIKYSPVVKVSMDKGRPGIDIYPNPVLDRQLNIRFDEMKKGIYQLRMINTTGQLIFSTSINHAGSTAIHTVLPTKIFADGTYRIEITGPDKKRMVRTVVVR